MKKASNNSARTFAGISILLNLIACGTAEKKEPCPTVQEEPISVCRAQEKCERQNSSVGIGLGIGFGNFGVGVGHSSARYAYDRCLDEDLKSQQAAAKSAPVEKPEK